MKIQESAENYLETIYILKKKNGSVRSIDVANELSFSKASVSVAMKSFREEDYITVDDDGTLNLTEKGLEIALRVYERHEILAKALMALGVDEETAYEDACRIEHYISDKSIKKIKEHFGEKSV
ncbi:MAG: metal-dependent transcriptional regulator [Ruminococcaceae bacterium]|nr:metal-dependent transcriptional regulator [Oscillospiraceae bacterium]